MGLFKQAAAFGLFRRFLGNRRNRRAYRGGGFGRGLGRGYGRRGLLRRFLG